jgi:quercetin dioxygenase-like cupin family protein
MKKQHGPQVSFCETGNSRKAPQRKTNRCSLFKHRGDFAWKGIKDEPYKIVGSGWSRIVRKVLIGSHGESAKFHVRYFEISPGGYSSLEHHRHEHVVICVQGEGVVRTGRTKRKMGFMDIVYISPNTVHQLANPFQNPFGFLCIVNSKRDRPKIVMNP